MGTKRNQAVRPRRLARALRLLGKLRWSRWRGLVRGLVERCAIIGRMIRAFIERAIPTLLIIGLLGTLILAAFIIFDHANVERPQGKFLVAPGLSSSVEPLGTWALIKGIAASDAKGRHASIDLLVLSRDFQWRIESTQVIEHAGQSVPLSGHLNAPGIRKLVASSKALIVVGSASEEGKRQSEEVRAVARAEQLGLWIKESIALTQPIYGLSLGQYVGPKRIGLVDGTVKQRTIVVISVRSMDDGTDLPHALRQGLRRTAAFPFNLDEYSAFSLWRQR